MSICVAVSKRGLRRIPFFVRLHSSAAFFVVVRVKREIIDFHTHVQPCAAEGIAL
jgi:hypothetical protein